MKKKTMMILLVMLFSIILTSCANRTDNDEESGMVYHESTTEMVVDLTSDSRNDSESNVENEEAPDTSIALLASSKYEPDSEEWSVEVVNNLIPVTVEELGDGITVPYTCRYTDDNGEMSYKTYENAAFVTREFSEVWDMYDQYIIESRTEKVNGEEIRGCFLLSREYHYYLKQTVGGEEILHLLDIQMPYNTYDIYMDEMMDGKCLIEVGPAYMYVCDMETFECTLIAENILTSQIEDDSFYWADYDRTEYVVSWTESTESKATGNEVFYYRTKSFEPERFEDDSINHDFEVMQTALKNGEAVASDFEEFYDVTYSGNVYRESDDLYCGNIHLPYAMSYNRNLMYSGYSYGAWFIEGKALNFYYFGDSVFSFSLEEGNWRIIVADTYKKKTEDGDNVKYDADGNGRVTAEEIKNAIDCIEMLLYNAVDNTVWTLNEKGEMSCILQDVRDYNEAYGQFYWMDGNDNAYELSWKESTESVLIGEDVVAISKHEDERAGFIVKPDDPRCNAAVCGEFFCTLYGNEWLNQEKTSGAWALEYDWSNPEALAE